MDDLKRKEIEGRRAEELADANRKILEEYKTELFNAFCASKWNDSETREHIYKQAQAVSDFENRLNKRIKEGSKARQKLAELAQKVKDRASEVFPRLG